MPKAKTEYLAAFIRQDVNDYLQRNFSVVKQSRVVEPKSTLDLSTDVSPEAWNFAFDLPRFQCKTPASSIDNKKSEIAAQIAERFSVTPSFPAYLGTIEIDDEEKPASILVFSMVVSSVQWIRALKTSDEDAMPAVNIMSFQHSYGGGTNRHPIAFEPYLPVIMPLCSYRHCGWYLKISEAYLEKAEPQEYGYTRWTLNSQLTTKFPLETPVKKRRVTTDRPPKK